MIDSDIGVLMAGNDVHPAMAQAQGLEDLVADLDLFHRIGREADADGVADPHPKQLAQPDGRLDRARGEAPGLGDAKVDRRVGLFGQLHVGGGGHEDIGRLATDLELVKIVVLQHLDMVQPAFDHGIGTGLAVFVQQVLFQRSRVHADAHGTAVIAGGRDDLLHPPLITDVAGIDAQTGGTRLGGLDAAPVVEMDVGDERHRAFAHDLFQRPRTGLVGHADPHDIRARLGGGLDLGDGAGDVRRLGIGHGLDRDRGVAAHGHVADHDLAAFAAMDVAPGAHRIERHVVVIL
jgi:hypothetical protein